MEYIENAKPFVKWVGGKKQLLPTLTELLPKNPISVYCEPFLGGGSLLFHLQPEVAFVNDMNTELINAYQVIRNNVDELIAILLTYENTEDFFYEIRSLDRDMEVFSALTDVQRAARFIFLNKTCYNGLYRVNRQGQFNAPFGKYTAPNFVNADVLYAIRDYLNRAQIHFTSGDFAYILSNLPRGAFVYFDPPYLSEGEKKSFTAYTSKCFSLGDHIRLYWWCELLSKRGIRIMQSNAYTPAILNMYQDYYITPVQARRPINCNGNGRGAVNEVVIRNYLY